MPLVTYLNFKNESELIEYIETNIKQLQYSDWRDLCRYCILPEKIIDKYIDKIPLNIICKTQSLNKEFIKKYKYHINWLIILQYQEVTESESFLIEHLEFIDNKICANFILKHKLIKDPDIIKYLQLRIL